MTVGQRTAWINGLCVCVVLLSVAGFATHGDLVWVAIGLQQVFFAPMLVLAFLNFRDRRRWRTQATNDRERTG